MSFQKNICTLLLVFASQNFFGAASAFSQDGSTQELARLTAEKNKSIEADRNANTFVKQYSSIVLGFEQDANVFQSAVASLESKVKSRTNGIGELSKAINSNLAIVLDPASSSADISRVWENFRQIRNQKNPCDDVVTVDAYLEMVNRATKMHAYESALTSLTTDRVFPSEHAPILAAARVGLATISSAVKQAETAVLGYKAAIEMPKVCELFRSFDVVIALASAAAEANEAAAAIDKIDINQFLKSIDDTNRANQAVTTARRMMTSIEGFFISGVRLGYLNRTQRFIDSYRDIIAGIVKNIQQSSLIGEKDKADLKAKADQTVANIEKEIIASSLRMVDGRRGMLLTRGRNIYAAIGKALKDTTGTEAQKKQLSDYSKGSLDMTFPGRYLVPQTPNIEAESDLDGKFDKAQDLLSKLGAK